MNRRLVLRRFLQTSAAVVLSAGLLLHWMRAPERKCRKDLVVRLDRLAVGEYELGIAGDGYDNSCQLTIGERGHLWVSCRSSEGVSVVPPDEIHFPVQLRQVKLELRHGADSLVAGTFTPFTELGSNGCVTQGIFAQL